MEVICSCDTETIHSLLSLEESVYIDNIKTIIRIENEDNKVKKIVNLDNFNLEDLKNTIQIFKKRQDYVFLSKLSEKFLRKTKLFTKNDNFTKSSSILNPNEEIFKPTIENQDLRMKIRNAFKEELQNVPFIYKNWKNFTISQRKLYRERQRDSQNEHMFWLLLNLEHKKLQALHSVLTIMEKNILEEHFFPITLKNPICYIKRRKRNPLYIKPEKNHVKILKKIQDHLLEKIGLKFLETQQLLLFLRPETKTRKSKYYYHYQKKNFTAARDSVMAALQVKSVLFETKIEIDIKIQSELGQISQTIQREIKIQNNEQRKKRAEIRKAKIIKWDRKLANIPDNSKSTELTDEAIKNLLYLTPLINCESNESSSEICQTAEDDLICKINKRQNKTRFTKHKFDKKEKTNEEIEIKNNSTVVLKKRKLLTYPSDKLKKCKLNQEIFENVDNVKTKYKMQNSLEQIEIEKLLENTNVESKEKTKHSQNIFIQETNKLRKFKQSLLEKLKEELETLFNENSQYILWQKTEQILIQNILCF